MILCLTPLAISFINLIGVVLTDSVDSCPTDGIHPSLDSCTIYTRCFHGFPFHFHCGKREVFDIESKSCVKYKQLQNCYKFDCTKKRKYAVYEGDPSYYAFCDKGKAIAIKLCKEGLIFDESKQTCVFKCHQAGIVQHPFDCTMYIECPFNFFKNFWIKRRCPPRSWFNPTKKICTMNELEKCTAAKNHISIHNTQQFTPRPERWRKKKKNDIQEIPIEQNDSVQINNELLQLGESMQELSVSKTTKHYRLNKGSSTTENNVNVIEDSSTDYYLKRMTDEISTTYQTKHLYPSDLIESDTNFYRHTTDTNYKQNYYYSRLSMILQPHSKSHTVLSTPDDLKMVEESGNFNTEITSDINSETVNFSSFTLDSLVVSTKPVKVTDESTYSHNFRTTQLKRNEKNAKNKQTARLDRKELLDLPSTNYPENTSHTTDSDYNLEQTQHYETSTLNTKETNEKDSKNKYSTNFDSNELTDSATPHSTVTNNDGLNLYYTNNFDTFPLNTIKPPNDKISDSSTMEYLSVPSNDDISKVTDKSMVSQFFSTPETYEENAKSSTFNTAELLPNPKPNNDSSTPESLPVTKNENMNKNTHESTASHSFTTEENPTESSINNHSLTTDGNGGLTMVNAQNFYTSTFNATLPSNDKSNNSSSAMNSLSVSTTENIHKVTHGSTVLYNFTTEQTIRDNTNEASSTTTFDQNELSGPTSTNYYLHSTVGTNSWSTSDYTQSNDASIVNSKLQPNSETNNYTSTTESLAIFSTMTDDGKATNKNTVSHTNAEYTTPEKNTGSTAILETSSFHQNELTDSPSMDYPLDGANKNNGDSTQNFNMSTLNSTLSPNYKANNSSSTMESLAESTTEDVNNKTNEEISTEPQSSNGDSLTDSMQNYSTSTFHVTSPQKDQHGNDTSSTESLALPTKENDGKATDKSTVSYTVGSTEPTTHGKNMDNSVNTETTSFHQNELSESPSTPSLNYPTDGSSTSESLAVFTTERVTNESTVSYTYTTIENATPKTNKEISTGPQSSNGDSTTDSMQNNFTSTVGVTFPPKDLPSNDTTSTESLVLPTKEDDGKATEKSTISYTFRSTEYTAHGKNKANSVTAETTFHENELSKTPSTPSLNYPSDGANTNNGDSMMDSTESNNLSTLNSSLPSTDKSNNSSSTPESLAMSTTERVTNESTVSYTFISTEHTTHGKNKENSATTSFHQNELSESPSTPSLNYPSDGENTKYGDATVHSTQNHYLSTLNSTLPPKDKSNSSSTEFLAESTTEEITDGSTILYTTTTEHTVPETNEENSKTTFSQNELSMSPSTNYDAHSTNAQNYDYDSIDYTQSYNASTFNVTFQPNHQLNNDSTTESLTFPTTADDAKIINKSSVSHNFRSTEHTTYRSSTSVKTTSAHQNELSESSTNYNSHSTDVSNGSTHHTQIYYPSTLNSTLPPSTNYNNCSFTTESIEAPSINYSSDRVNTHDGESTVNSTQNYMSTVNSPLPPNTKSNDDSFTTKSLPISTTEDTAKITADITVSHSYKTTKYTTQQSVENTTHLSELSPSFIPNYTSDTQYGHSTKSTGNYPQNYTFSSETSLPPSSPTQNVATKGNICEQNAINVGTMSAEVNLKNSPTTMSSTLLTLPWIDTFVLTRQTVHSCAQSKSESTIKEHDNSTESTTESSFSPDFQTSNFTTNVVTIDHTSGEFKTPITVTPVPTVLETTSPDAKEFAIGIGTATTPFSFTTTFHDDDAETTTISPTSEIAVLPWS